MTTTPTTPPTVVSRDPVSGEVWAEFPSANEERVGKVVEETRKAASSWKNRPLAERRAVLARFRRIVVERRTAIADVISRETGKSTTEAFFEIFGTAELARYYAKISPRILKARTRRSSNLAVWRKRIRTVPEPYGVIAAITPWNYPFFLASGLVIPALVSGNGFILKPSELTPSCGELIRDLMIESGIPESVLQVVQGTGSTGSALIESGIDKVFFVGSQATGRKVAAKASETMTPYVLELGGSDPAIVLDDAHLPTAASGIAWGRFANAGQTCVAPKRIFVVESVFDEFLGHLKKVVQKIEAEARDEIGPVITPDQRALLDEQLDDAVELGARVAAGSTTASDETRFSPVVLVGVRPGMRVLDEETFGPILPVVSVRDEQDAIERANATQFGLSASIWSRDVERATRIAQRIDAGSVTINDSVVVALLADISYGGVKSSGTGRTHGEDGLRECIRSRSIVIDRFARFRETYWHYYKTDARRGFEEFLIFAHGRGLLRRIVAAIRTVWLLYLKR
ncbi:MAG: aldehyde dehydrogenase family protein [Thermoanaerobaculia bacterium]|nr:aldehyde dehydrogenase family protein [Thermoanaerobaculia bacterium]